MGAYPAGHLPMLARPGGVRDLVVLVIAVDDVLENSTALKDADRLAVGELVGQGGNAAIGVDFEEPRLLLLIVGHADWVDLEGADSVSEWRYDVIGALLCTL